MAKEVPLAKTLVWLDDLERFTASGLSGDDLWRLLEQNSVVMEAYVHGVSTRRVDDLVEAMGVEAGISKSEVSRICAGLDESVRAFRTRSLERIAFPYVYLDATYLHVRSTNAQVVSMAVVVATGIAADGSREVLGLDVGDSEDETFWRSFLLSLKQRGSTGSGS